jgi:hypothetical protein
MSATSESWKPFPLGILPIGTFNNIARNIGVPADLPVATNIIATGHVSEIDVGLRMTRIISLKLRVPDWMRRCSPSARKSKADGGRACAGRAARVPIPVSTVQHHLRPTTLRGAASAKPNADERGYSCRHDYPPQSVTGSGRQRSLLRRRFRRGRRRMHTGRATDAFHLSALQQMGAASSFPFDLPTPLPAIRPRSRPSPLRRSNSGRRRSLRCISTAGRLVKRRSSCAPCLALCGSLRRNIPWRRRGRGEHMPDSHNRAKKSDNANAQERAREALERGAAEIKTPQQARHALDSLEKIAEDLREEDVARAGSDAAPEQQASAIEEAEDVAVRAASSGWHRCAFLDVPATGSLNRGAVDRSRF